MTTLRRLLLASMVALAGCGTSSSGAGDSGPDGPLPCDEDGHCPFEPGPCGGGATCQPPGPGVDYPACVAVAPEPAGTECDNDGDPATEEQCDGAGACVPAS